MNILHINDALSYISIYNVLSYLGVNTEETLKQDDIAKDKGIANHPITKPSQWCFILHPGAATKEAPRKDDITEGKSPEGSYIANLYI